MKNLRRNDSKRFDKNTSLKKPFKNNEGQKHKGKPGTDREPIKRKPWGKRSRELERLRHRIAVLEDKKAKLKETEKLLKERELWFRTLLEAGRDAVFTLKDGVFIDCNAKTLEMFQCRKEQIINRPPYNFSPEYQPDGSLSSKKASKKIKAAFTGEPQIFEWTHTRYDGSPFEAEVFLNRVEFSGDVYLQAVVRDISLQKKAEREQQQSEEKYRILTEGLKDVVLSISPRGTVEYCSPAITDFGGFIADEQIGKDISNYFAKHIELSRTLMRLKNVTLQTPSTTFEFMFLPASKKPFPVEITVKPLVKDDKVVSLQCVMRDISERIEAQKERQRLEERLLQSEKMEAIGRLAGGVAHDLNNMLSAVVSYPDLLLMKLPQDSPLRKPILTIKKSGLKAAAVVEDLLTLARRGVKNKRVVNLNEIVKEYLKSPEYKKLRRFYPDVRIVTEFDDDLFNIVGSQIHLTKALMNLVTNAAEAIPGKGTIIIATLNLYPTLTADGIEPDLLRHHVVLTVSDTGMGIKSQDKEKIFEPFYSRKIMGRSGTGLGMAVVWGTVQDHDGYINFHTVEGEGTTFELYFPVTSKPMLDDESHIPFEEYVGNGEQILVVDDVDAQREIAATLLTKLGYNVQSVESGTEAVGYCKDLKKQVDLIVLDMILGPGLDGLETYREILKFRPHARAIIVSGFSETGRVKETQHLGAGLYLKKPYTLEQIGLAVKKELERENNPGTGNLR